MLKTILCAFFFLSISMNVMGQGFPVADLIITNASVYTVDKDHPRAEAVAVAGERIVATGSNAEVERWRGPKTKVIDAGGRLVLPGFNDSHVHFVDGGADLDRVQLNDAVSAQNFVDRIAAQVKKTPNGEWITGGNWDETKWDPPTLPSKDLIDAVTKSTPVFISRYDGHQALANSAAMKLAGITSKTPDVPGGVILRDARGNPTGIFKDAAENLIFNIIPDMTHQQRLRAIKRALDYAASLGVTSVQHMSAAYDDIAVYSELAEQGELTTRIYAAPIELSSDHQDSWADQAKLGLRRGFGSPYLRLGAIKGFADGSIGSRTAYLFKPFSDDPTNVGILADEMIPFEGMLDRMMKADAAGLQLCIHAIGDRGVSMILDIYDAIEKAHGVHDQRFRIEHAQHVTPKDFERFASLHVIASMQPYHAIDDGRWVEARIGHERAQGSYAWRSMLDHKVVLAFGTDWDVAPLDPMLSLYAAVTRATLDGKNPAGWIPEQKITLAEAVEAYTMGSAFAEFQEKEKGSITPGKLADLVILSDNIFDKNPEDIGKVKVQTTIVGGKVVYEAQAAP